jgi:hypothetical protein
MATDHHLNALINASNCVRSDLSCGVIVGILRSIPSNSIDGHLGRADRILHRKDDVIRNFNELADERKVL